MIIQIVFNLLMLLGKGMFAIYVVVAMLCVLASIFLNVWSIITNIKEIIEIERS